MLKQRACGIFIAVVLVAASGSGSLAQGAGLTDNGWMVRARAAYLDMDNQNSPSLGVTAEDRWIPEVDISYFFTPNWAAELVLTYPQKHDVSLGGTKIGSFKHLPPTLLLQYHFLPDRQFRPYVGAGVNYTRISSVDIPGVELDSHSTGMAWQVGTDIGLDRNWSINLDVKKIYIGTDVNAGGVKLTTLDLDPMVYSIGVGYRF